MSVKVIFDYRNTISMLSYLSIFRIKGGKALILFLSWGLATHAQTPSYTLYPPTNLQMSGVECSVYVTWEKPAINESTGLLGYRIYRDGTYQASISDQDSTWFWDFTLETGYRTYSVSAYYSLAEFGYPGYYEESPTVGPDSMLFLCDIPFPFCENWDCGSFAFNGWNFYPSQGTWYISNGDGNPPPAATFPGLPADTGYSYTLSYDRLNTYSPTYCNSITIDFDIKLIDVNSTGEEKMAVEVYYDLQWHLMELLANTGSFDWETHHHEFIRVQDGIMKIRFRVFGENSTDIASWQLDNICVAIAYNPPESPAGMLTGQEVYLTWSPPICEPGVSPTGYLEEIACHDGNPYSTNSQVYDWVYGSLFDLSAYPYTCLHSIDFHHSSSGLYDMWKYRVHVVDWLSKTEVATIGPFFTTGDDQWETTILLDSISGLSGGTVGIFIQPMDHTPDNAYPRVSFDSNGPQGTSLVGSFPDYNSLSPFTAGDFLINLWIWIPDGDGYVQPAKMVSIQDYQEVEGYMVYRSSDGMATFSEMTPDPIPDTNWIDIAPPLNVPVLYYYIKASYVFGYNLSEPSDTVVILVTPVQEKENLHLTVYPNPVSSVLHIISDQPVSTIKVVDLMGKEVLVLRDVQAIKKEIDVSALPAGLYCVKVTTTNGTKSVKISVRK